MFALTDRLGLNNHNLFKILREDSNNFMGVRTNIDCKDDMLYVWNSKSSCILTLALKPFFRALDHNEVNYQILRPSYLPLGVITQLIVSYLSTQVALISDSRTRIYIVDIPKRWGGDGVFEGGKEEITCKSRVLSPCGMRETILQARWHPGSRTDSHLVVLYSDNVLRVFDTEDTTVVQLIILGNMVHRKRGLSTLGDIAVDFDFCLPTVRKTKKKKNGETDEVVSPILVLRGNGDVFYVIVSLYNENERAQPVVQGPLQMFPPADDNYGGDASAILILRTTPPVVIISSCSGTLYHALLLESYNANDGIDNSLWSGVNSTNSNIQHNIALYIFEAIELELGLSTQDGKTENATYSCPLHLMKDMYFFGRYMCIHDTGVHLITMPIILQLDSYAKSKTDDLEMFIQSFSQYISSAEYLVCTRINETTVLLPVGVCVVPSPDTLIILLANGEVLSLHLPYLRVPFSSIPGSPKSQCSEQKERFDDYIKNLLKPVDARTLPVLKLDSGAKPSPPEALEILRRATIFFRNEVFQHYQTAIEEIERRVRSLMLHKAHQQEEIKLLQADKTELQSTAEQLAEKYEEINDKQAELMKRGEHLLLKARSQFNHMTRAEKTMSTVLKEYSKRVEELQKSLEQIQSKIKDQKLYANHMKTEDKRKNWVLSDKQTRITGEYLKRMSLEILQLRNRVNRVKSFVQHH